MFAATQTVVMISSVGEHKHSKGCSPSLPVPMSWSSIARICAWADMFVSVQLANVVWVTPRQLLLTHAASSTAGLAGSSTATDNFTLRGEKARVQQLSASLVMRLTGPTDWLSQHLYRQINENLSRLVTSGQLSKCSVCLKTALVPGPYRVARWKGGDWMYKGGLDR